jgi:hypothetical protein
LYILLRLWSPAPSALIQRTAVQQLISIRMGNFRVIYVEYPSPGFLSEEEEHGPPDSVICPLLL